MQILETTKKETHSSEEAYVFPKSTYCAKKGDDKYQETNDNHDYRWVSGDTGEFFVITLLCYGPKANTHHDSTNTLKTVNKTTN